MQKTKLVLDKQTSCSHTRTGPATDHERFRARRVLHAVHDKAVVRRLAAQQLLTVRLVLMHQVATVALQNVIVDADVVLHLRPLHLEKCSSLKKQDFGVQ